MSTLVIVSVFGAAALQRLGVLSKEKRDLSLTEWLGHLITGGFWGFIAAVAASHLWSLPALPLVAVAAVVGYMGDKRAFDLVRSLVGKHSGLELQAKPSTQN